MQLKIMTSKWKACMAMTAVAAICAAFLLSGPVQAADNIGTGDIGGDTSSLNSSNTFSLFTTTLSLTKMAFLANGTALANSTVLPRGTEVRFVVYVDNTTTFPLNDVSIQDVLDPVFAYQAGSMQFTTMAAGATQAVIYSNVNAVAGTLTDAATSADVASYAGSTIDVGNQNATNGTLDVPGSSVWAIMFRTLMQ
jgi:uncharacterized repeat protein (TIGR01451 family)